MMTARTSLGDRIEGYHCGADVFLPKPVDPKELLAVINALASRIVSNQQKEALILDIGKMVLIGPKNKSSLTKRECLLLSGFAGTPDYTLERWQIMELLDPEKKGVSADCLEVCISQLRKKLNTCAFEMANGQPIIKAIRGYGYRLLLTLSIR